MKLARLFLLPLTLSALACGKKSDDPAAEGANTPSAAAATVGSSTPAPTSSGTAIMPTYASNLTKVADALEAVSDEATARAAARAIAAAAQEMKLATDRLEQMGDFQKAAALMQGATTLIEPNTRISLAMAKIANDHPELLEIIGNEMDNLPSLE